MHFLTIIPTILEEKGWGRMKIRSSLVWLALVGVAIVLGMAHANARVLASPVVPPAFEQPGNPARVSAVNPPTATNDSYAVSMNATLNVPAISGVLTNDVDPDGDTLTAVIDSPAASGSLTLNPDGSFLYIPSPDFTGPDSFTYHANDGALDSNPATVTIQVQAGNAFPVAINDAYVIPQNNALSVSSPGVLANDFDSNGDALSAVLDFGTSNGTLTLNNDGSFAYTPNQNFLGMDAFTYHVSDGNLDSSPTQVKIEVFEVNLAPIAADDTYTVTQDSELSIQAPGVLYNDSDPNGDPLTAILDDTAEHGTLIFNADGSFTYTPQTGFYGEDFFRYRADDGLLESQRVQAKISVLAVDKQPPQVTWASPVADQGIQEVGDEVVRLEVAASDNSGVASVRFYRWDAVEEVNVEIGIVYAPPYRWDLDTRVLNLGWNQINAKAYDTSGNDSELGYIWLLKLGKIFLPIMSR
jgi:VCBS repeat-containing protein